MDFIQKQIQLQFQGFLNTDFLWEHGTVLGIEQIKLSPKSNLVFNETLPEYLRLGKRVERFVSAELKAHNDISICCENIQIQKEKTTLGEIDCILKQKYSTIHLEIVYKFYLYDPKVSNKELLCWIGPNRRDSLIEKLHKLKDKQLPLLYSQYTKPILNKLKIPVETIKQQVYFKAQLFVPFNYNKNIDFSGLNPKCVKGFYIHHTELNMLDNCKFYITGKHNWLEEPSHQVNWLSYHKFYKEIQIMALQKIAPMCWVKYPNGQIKKSFVVWWS